MPALSESHVGGEQRRWLLTASCEYLYNAGLWSPNGQWLAAEGDELGVITLFSASGQLIGYFHEDCIGGEDEGVAWLPDGRLSFLV
jgi:hypothetical protein